MKILMVILAFTFLSGCSSAVKLLPPETTQKKSLSEYKFVIIPREKKIVYASSSVSKEMFPDDLIEGVLLKKGIVRLSELPEKNTELFLIAKFAVSGKRSVYLGMGYTMEVTIVLMEAETLNIVYSCTAEGLGSTEVDDIRAAIINCMSGLK